MISMSKPSVALALLLPLTMAVAATAAPIAGSEQQAASSFIDYQSGRLNARIENRPLVEVLRELAAATGARFVVTGPGSEQVAVSATVESQPFSEGMQKILKGCSYAIYTPSGEKLPTVIVLLSGEGPGSASAQGDRVFISSALLPGHAGGDSEADRTAALARDQADYEKTLNDGIAALRTERGPSQQAFDQLVGVQDPRVTQALVQAAGAADSRARAQATEALWHHAADLRFADQASISALERLANDADTEVQSTARQALEDMKQYRQRDPSQ